MGEEGKVAKKRVRFHPVYGHHLVSLFGSMRFGGMGAVVDRLTYTS